MDCYQIPATPVPLLLPVECVADVYEKPDIEELKESRANWMRGHVTWRNQRIPVMSYSALHNVSLDESKKRKPQMVILNPVPDAVRKAYSGIICFGSVEKVTVDESAIYCDLPQDVDKRYVEAAIEFKGTVYLVPRLAALAVAFSYF